MQHPHLVGRLSLDRIRGKVVRHGLPGCVLLALPAIPMIKANTHYSKWNTVFLERRGPYAARAESLLCEQVLNVLVTTTSATCVRVHRSLSNRRPFLFMFLKPSVFSSAVKKLKI
jgi:hypothetical protein